ncbi:ABC transporter ATP-binding protein [Nostoc sp. FACHB-190]|uniref:ABC transporter ATP-binding protein n=1 Tax=Nostoc sp. FACHB-190 TaxID=2692838 RepID=UPI001689FC69|nr:ABC transporter ATP-binding protein [Nostoc sp. FACHB-190]MBD2297078.1 ABC transporter ATP-binding protein [Nostoc sp. FACHB-190]
MTDVAIAIRDLGKMYRLYRHPADKVLDAFGVNKFLFWRKHYYQEFWALRGLNLEIKKGERLGLIGRNGAGKSTLLKIITGNVAPTEGKAEVKGRVQALMELGTGFHPEFTGRQNIQASLAYQGLSQAKIRELEEEIIDFSELEDFIDQPIKTYSAGMYARLAFTVATVIEPEILIIDEVLGAGDAYFAGKCVERMKKLTEESGATVLFVSHDLGSVQALCNRAIWIDKGTIRAEGQPLNIIKQYTALVRHDEEIRLRARDLKVSKKQAVLLERKQDIYEKFLFRLVGIDGSHPVGVHKIRTLSIWYGYENIGHIQVGAPLDNHPDQEHYLMNEKGFMDWGKSMKDELGYYRQYANFKGRYAHAPFEFSIPKSYLNKAEELKLEICAECEQECVAVEIFIPEKHQYHRLGILKQGAYDNKFIISIINHFIDTEIELDNSKEAKAASQLEIDEYGSKNEVLITQVNFIDANGKETKTLCSLAPFQVVIEYIAKVPVYNPTFVFCIYLPSGLTASQWLVSSQEMGREIIDGRGKVVFQSESLLLGRGSYVASVALFKWRPQKGLEPESYHVLDRCIHFQIVNTDETDIVDYGICRQPIIPKLFLH